MAYKRTKKRRNRRIINLFRIFFLSAVINRQGMQYFPGKKVPKHHDKTQKNQQKSAAFLKIDSINAKLYRIARERCAVPLNPSLNKEEIYNFALIQAHTRKKNARARSKIAKNSKKYLRNCLTNHARRVNIGILNKQEGTK